MNREKELSGGIKNALERGETLAKAKQSFLNSGYKPQEIEAAVRNMASSTQPIRQPLVPGAQPGQPTPTQPNQQMPAQPGQPQSKKSVSKTFIIIASIIAVIVLGVAAFLGLYWNKIF
ncbi:hypothetical protein HNV12_03145 [Methanococcoides sp. SA1]|nr:hypothetical protein [Methanococcoides sp. SA1]